MHGDLTHESPQLDFPAAERLIDRFLKIWKDHTDLSTFFTFGNHDLVGTKNASVNREDPRFGKGLYRMRLSLGLASIAISTPFDKEGGDLSSSMMWYPSLTDRREHKRAARKAFSCLICAAMGDSRANIDPTLGRRESE
jgi:hypothetical protein